MFYFSHVLYFVLLVRKYSAHRRSLSNSEHKAQQSNKGMGRRMQSVHGNDVWSSWAKGDKKKGGRASMMI